jgi:prevent-host-death family protein
MKIVNIYEAKTHLSRLLREVALGEDVVIAKDGRPLARLVPVTSESAPRELGFAAGRVVIGDDFDAPLPPELQAGFDAEPGEDPSEDPSR